MSEIETDSITTIEDPKIQVQKGNKNTAIFESFVAKKNKYVDNSLSETISTIDSNVGVQAKANTKTERKTKNKTKIDESSISYCQCSDSQCDESSETIVCNLKKESKKCNTTNTPCCSPTAKAGTPGQPGCPGRPGPPGCPGVPGCKGDRGPRGEQGYPGCDGEKGCPGPKGYPGCQGHPGERGEKGKDGTEILCKTIDYTGDSGCTLPAQGCVNSYFLQTNTGTLWRWSIEEDEWKTIKNVRCFLFYDSCNLQIWFTENSAGGCPSKQLVAHCHDWIFDCHSKNIYVYTSKGWVLKCNLQGPVGPTGPAGPNHNYRDGCISGGNLEIICISDKGKAGPLIERPSALEAVNDELFLDTTASMLWKFSESQDIWLQDEKTEPYVFYDTCSKKLYNVKEPEVCGGTCEYKACNGAKILDCCSTTFYEAKCNKWYPVCVIQGPTGPTGPCTTFTCIEAPYKGVKVNTNVPPASQTFRGYRLENGVNKVIKEYGLNEFGVYAGKIVDLSEFSNTTIYFSDGETNSLYQLPIDNTGEIASISALIGVTEGEKVIDTCNSIIYEWHSGWEICGGLGTNVIYGDLLYKGIKLEEGESPPPLYTGYSIIPAVSAVKLSEIPNESPTVVDTSFSGSGNRGQFYFYSQNNQVLYQFNVAQTPAVPGVSAIPMAFPNNTLFYDNITGSVYYYNACNMSWSIRVNQNAQKACESFPGRLISNSKEFKFESADDSVTRTVDFEALKIDSCGFTLYGQHSFKDANLTVTTIDPINSDNSASWLDATNLAITISSFINNELITVSILPLTSPLTDPPTKQIIDSDLNFRVTFTYTYGNDGTDLTKLIPVIKVQPKDNKNNIFYKEIVFRYTFTPLETLFGLVTNNNALIGFTKLINLNNVYSTVVDLETISCNSGLSGWPERFTSKNGKCIQCYSGIFSGTITNNPAINTNNAVTVTGRVTLEQISQGVYSLLFAVPKGEGFPPNAEVCLNYQLNGQISNFVEGKLQAYSNNIYYPPDTLSPQNFYFIGDNIVAVYTGCSDFTELSIIIKAPNSGSLVQETTSNSVLFATIPDNADFENGTVTISVNLKNGLSIVQVYQIGA